MKTRIISGIVMGVIVAAVLSVGMLWNPIIITLAISILAAGAAYELLHNAVGITSKPAIIGACLYSALAVFSIGYTFWAYFAVSVLYFIYAVIIILKNHKEFDLAKIAAFAFMPLGLAFAFVSLEEVINLKDGIYHLLLLLNFSSVCDMGAYFTGVTIGKHKLCPNISPKKTVEGAVGGVVSSMIVTVILTLCFNQPIILPVILTIPFCVLGVLGDLFASIIKRSVDLKDYGNLIPGHGGILDRVDSILMIAPPLFILIAHGVL